MAAAAGASLDFFPGKNWRADLAAIQIPGLDDALQRLLGNFVIEHRESYGVQVIVVRATDFGLQDSRRWEVLFIRWRKKPDRMVMLRIWEASFTAEDLRYYKELFETGGE